MSEKNKKQKNLKADFKVLWNYVVLYKRDITIITLASAFIGAVGAVLPYLMGKTVDGIINQDVLVIFSKEYKSYVVIFAVYILLLFIDIFFTYFKSLWAGLLKNKIFVNYKKTAFEKMISLPFSFHKSKKFGSWSATFDRASGSLSWILAQNLSNMLPEVFVLLFSLVISYSVNPILGLILTVGVAVYSFVIFRVTPQIEKLAKEENNNYKKLQGLFFESFSNIFEVKKNTTESKESLNFKRESKVFRGKMDNLTRKWRSVGLQRGLVSSVTRVIVLVLAIHWATEGVISVGEILILNAYAFRVFRPIAMLSDIWTYVMESLVKIVDAEDTMALAPEVYKKSDNKLLPKDFKGEIEFSDVEFSYEDKDAKVLKKVNLKIEKGQKVAFVGESGVGKSTAIDLIGGFYFPQKGSVKVDGIDSKELGLEDLRSKIAFVSQDISLFNDTVENNIKYGAKRVGSEKVIEASKKAFADEFIKKFPKKYKQKVGNRGIKLSGGQKQRISIARAILRDPKILILDEPTSSLDIKSEKYITESLDDLMEGRTTIIIAHRLSTVRNVDKIFVFKGGKIVEEGNHKELLALGGEYKNMHDMHIGLN
jgi:ATP-binding cassette subfamily B multidrug efflux pump